MHLVKRIAKETLLQKIAWEGIDSEYLRQLVGLAKIEDLAGAGLDKRPRRLGDVTTALMPENTIGSARLIARESMVLAGLGLVQITLDAYGENCIFEAASSDGTAIEKGTVIGTITGPASALLQAERVLLNFLQHLAGIASETSAYAQALGESSTVLLDTRKTLPGYRILQKYAFACGGGYNHRMGLFDRIMLKDNHLAVAGASGGDRLTKTVSLARTTCEELPIEVEVDRIDQILPVLEAGADIILLDNFSIPELEEAIALIGDAAYTEASGGIQIDTLPSLAKLGLDFISTGAPVHQSRWKDIGLDWS